MRDRLVNTQIKEGKEKGSWLFRDSEDPSADSRLYCTALAAMTLEVYYRYLPIYQKAKDGEDDFPLE